MSSPGEKSKKSEFDSTLKKRIVWVLLICCIQLIYIPTSNRVIGGIEPKLPIDVFPIWPVWVVPYVLCYVLWLTSMVWIVIKVDDHRFRSFAAACLLTFSLGALTFLFFPTYVKASAFEDNDLFTTILRSIHENWGRYDALPSGHVYITTLLALFFGRWYPRRKFVWLSVVVVVSLSTLFTGQHYILDVIGGYLVAVAGYHFGLWWTGFDGTQRRARKRVPSSTVN